jgi:hypothetical protein
MNARQLYLAWLRTVAPTVYVSAVRRATGQNRSLGGLDSDLVQQALSQNISHSFLGDDILDPITVTAQSMQPITTDFSFDSSTIPFDQSSVAAPASVAIDTSVVSPLAPQNPAASNSVFAGVLAAVGSITSSVLNASTQSKLITLNTQRAAQGLPPVNAAGQVISPVATSATGSALLNFERSISGGMSSMGSMLPLLGLGALALYFFRKKSA